MTTHDSVWITNWTMTPDQVDSLMDVFVNERNAWPDGLKDCHITNFTHTHATNDASEHDVRYMGLDFSGSLDYFLPPPLCVVLDFMIKKEMATFESLWTACLPYLGGESRIRIKDIRHAVTVINHAVTFLLIARLRVTGGTVLNLDPTMNYPDVEDLFFVNAIIYSGIIVELENDQVVVSENQKLPPR